MTRASLMAVSRRRSRARTASSWSAPTAPTARYRITNQIHLRRFAAATISAATAGRTCCRRSVAWDSRPRERGRPTVVPPVSRGRRSIRRIRCIGRACSRTGTTCARTAIRPALRRNYDAATRRLPPFAEIDVSCESCHGPGSATRLGAQGAGWESRCDQGPRVPAQRAQGRLLGADPATGNARAVRLAQTTREIETCAHCHSRRGADWADVGPGAPIGDSYRVALLDDDLYFPDGQIRDEVYEYGSFLQSRMFHAGVTCSDCHEPHSLKLRAWATASACNVIRRGQISTSPRTAPRARHGGREMRLLSHADAHLYGCRSPARSQSAHSSPRSQREAGHAERLQQLPRRQVAAMGGGADQVLAPFAGSGLSAFRSSAAGGDRRRAGRAGASARARQRSDQSRHRARERGCAPRPHRQRRRNSKICAPLLRDRRPAGAPGDGGGLCGGAAQPPRGPRAAARRSHSRRAAGSHADAGDRSRARSWCEDLRRARPGASKNISPRSAPTPTARSPITIPASS